MSERNTRVFLSYSRRDRSHLERLLAAFKSHEFDVFRDLDDILPTEDWWDRIKILIGQADIFVFLVSENSIDSRVCLQELAHAESLRKRLAPVVVSEVDAANIPDALRKLNFIFLDGNHTAYDAAFSNLLTAITIDIGWLREHTRLGEAARRWHTLGRPSSALLRGKDIESGERWLSRSGPDKPEPTDLQRTYVAASRRARKMRSRFLAASLVILVATAAAASVILLGSQESEAIAKQRQLADAARARLGNGDAVEAALVALEAVPNGRWSYLRSEENAGEIALYAALHRGPGSWNPFGHQGDLTAAAIAPRMANATVATASKDGTVRLWDVASGRQKAVLIGHWGPVNAVEFSPDGNQILTAGADRTARLWDASTARQRLVLYGHTAPVTQGSFNPAGDRVVTVGDDGAARVWRVADGRQVSVLQAEQNLLKPNKIRSARFMPDGSAILMVEEFITTFARLFDPATGRVAKRLARIARVPEDPDEYYLDERLGYSFAWSPDGRRVVAHRDGRLRLIDAESGETIVELLREGGTVEASAAIHLPATTLVYARFSADGARMVTATKNQKDPDSHILHVHATHDGRQVCATEPVMAEQFTYYISPDARFVVASAGTALHVWNGDTCQPLGALGTGGAAPRQLSQFTFASNGDYVLESPFNEDTLQVWRLAKPETGQPIEIEIRPRVDEASLGPTGKRLVGRWADTWHLWNAETGAHIGSLEAATGRGKHASFGLGGKRILTYGKEGGALWDAESGARIADLRPGTLVTYADFTRQDEYLYMNLEGKDRGSIWSARTGETLGSSGKIDPKFWRQITSIDGRHDIGQDPRNKTAVAILDVSNERVVASLEGRPPTIGCDALSRDNSTLLTADSKGGGWLYSFPSGVLIGTIGGHRDAIRHSCLSPSGDRVLTAGFSDPVPRLWNGRSARLVSVLPGHDGPLRSAGFGLDGRRLATSAKKTLLWDTENGRKIASIPMGVEDRFSKSLFFSGAGSVMLIGTKLWRVFPSTGALKEWTQHAIPRCLSAEERQEFGLRESLPGWCFNLSGTPAAAGKRPSINERKWDGVIDALLANVSRFVRHLRIWAQSVPSSRPK